MRDTFAESCLRSSRIVAGKPAGLGFLNELGMCGSKPSHHVRPLFLVGSCVLLRPRRQFYLLDEPFAKDYLRAEEASTAFTERYVSLGLSGYWPPTKSGRYLMISLLPKLPRVITSSAVNIILATESTDPLDLMCNVLLKDSTGCEIQQPPISTPASRTTASSSACSADLSAIPSRDWRC